MATCYEVYFYQSYVSFPFLQRTEVDDISNRIEVEGCKRSLDELEKAGVTIECMVTDRSPAIKTLLERRHILRYNDIWHIVKGILNGLESSLFIFTSVS